MVVAIGDIIQTVSQVIHGETTDLGLNVWSHEVTAVPPGGDADVAIDMREYVDNFMNAMIANLAVEYSGGQVEVFNRTKDEFVGAQTLTWAGTATNDGLPPTVCALFLGKTNTKRVSGRKYIMGLDQESENTGRFTVGALAAFNLAVPKYVDHFVSIVGGEYDPGAARELFGVWSLTKFTTGQVMPTNRTQRSRTVGRGI